MTISLSFVDLWLPVYQFPVTKSFSNVFIRLNPQVREKRRVRLRHVVGGSERDKWANVESAKPRGLKEPSHKSINLQFAIKHNRIRPFFFPLIAIFLFAVFFPLLKSDIHPITHFDNLIRQPQPLLSERPFFCPTTRLFYVLPLPPIPPPATTTRRTAAK